MKKLIASLAGLIFLVSCVPSPAHDGSPFCERVTQLARTDLALAIDQGMSKEEYVQNFQTNAEDFIDANPNELLIWELIASYVYEMEGSRTNEVRAICYDLEEFFGE